MTTFEYSLGGLSLRETDSSFKPSLIRKYIIIYGIITERLYNMVLFIVV